MRAYDPHPDLEKLQREHRARESQKPKKQRVKFIPPTDLLADKAGYIVWKDKKTVVFYHK